MNTEIKTTDSDYVKFLNKYKPHSYTQTDKGDLSYTNFYNANSNLLASMTYDNKLHTRRMTIMEI